MSVLPLRQERSSYRTAPDPAAIQEIADEFARGKNIALIAGEQVDESDSMADLVKLAELLNCHVYLPPIPYRYDFPSRHELFRGILPPAMGPIGERLAGYDVGTWSWVLMSLDIIRMPQVP